MGRRGFFAELQRQARLRQRELARETRELDRQRATYKREAERLAIAEARARKELARASEWDRKRREKEFHDAHAASMQAEVERLNSDLAVQADELESLLAATLGVDDYVDLEQLRRTVSHPPFEHAHLQVPVLPPKAIAKPEEPVFVAPPPPSSWWGKLFGRKKHAAEVADAQAKHLQAVAGWTAKMESWSNMVAAAEAEHARAEKERLARLQAARERYATECAAREAEQEKKNQALDALIANLGYGEAAAVQEYVGIVLSNSVYPDHFPVEHEFEFDPRTAELKLEVTVPGPDKLSTTKAYKYTKSSDEITETKLANKACKDRYASAVHQVAIRTIHEVFEADRRGLIKTISLEVGTRTSSPATGLATRLLFVAVAVERKAFVEFDLAAVVPSATLAHLGASVSKNPYDLLPASATGVRRA
jgi:restriction system protein